MIDALKSLLPPSEHDAFELALRERPDRCVRLHCDRSIDVLPFETEPVAWSTHGRWLRDASIRPGAFLQYAACDYYIQDAASLLPLKLLDVKPGQLICDLCAAPGGKASAIAELLMGAGCLIANESIRSRLDVLRYSLARTRRTNYVTTCSDPDELANELTELCDTVLVDAPCSGQSLVGRNKRDDNAFAPKQIEHCAARQRRILLAAARMLKPGGRLVYSTCTFARQENEEQIEWLMQTMPGAWEPIVEPSYEAWQSPILMGTYRLWPHRDRCSGGFAAGLRRIGELTFDDDGTEQIKPGHRVRNKRLHQSSKNSRGDRRATLMERDAMETFASVGLSDIVRFCEPNVVLADPATDEVLETCNGLKYDEPLAMLQSGKHWVPTHALSLLAGHGFVPHQSLNLTDEEAFRFVSGESIAAPMGDPTLGWSVVRWRDKSLGWVKCASGRRNNHLPSWARMGGEIATGD